MATVFHSAAGAVDKAGNQIQQTTRRVGTQLQATTDRIFPPQQREESLQRLRVFANRNPKLAVFLTTQTALAGFPILLFLAFATATLLASLTTCILLGLVASLAFTSFIVGSSLLFVVPTVIVASCSATFISVWAYIGYIILLKLNGGEAPAKPGTRVGDKLQVLTGGRLNLWIGDGADADFRRKAARVGTTSTTKHRDHIDGSEDHGDTKHQHSSGELNGADPSGGYVEWQRKWDDGVQQQPVILETGNTYEILKKETPAA